MAFVNVNGREPGTSVSESRYVFQYTTKCHISWNQHYLLCRYHQDSPIRSKSRHPSNLGFSKDFSNFLILNLEMSSRKILIGKMLI